MKRKPKRNPVKLGKKRFFLCVWSEKMRGVPGDLVVVVDPGRFQGGLRRAQRLSVDVVGQDALALHLRLGLVFGVSFGVFFGVSFGVVLAADLAEAADQVAEEQLLEPALLLFAVVGAEDAAAAAGLGFPRPATPLRRWLGVLETYRSSKLLSFNDNFISRSFMDASTRG